MRLLFMEHTLLIWMLARRGAIKSSGMKEEMTVYLSSPQITDIRMELLAQSGLLHLVVKLSLAIFTPLQQNLGRKLHGR